MILAIITSSLSTQCIQQRLGVIKIKLLVAKEGTAKKLEGSRPQIGLFLETKLHALLKRLFVVTLLLVAIKANSQYLEQGNDKKEVPGVDGVGRRSLPSHQKHMQLDYILHTILPRRLAC